MIHVTKLLNKMLLQKIQNVVLWNIMHFSLARAGPCVCSLHKFFVGWQC